ncbi:MAG: glycoside hydrolase [Actinobacteria bacterium]|nr:glycoside hydrolase [Actinomycetota bacterium]
MRVCVLLVKRPRLALLRAAAAAALVVAVTAASAGAANASVIGPDVSSHNHDNRATVNWGVMHRAGGASFTFIKATEGVDYLNPRFASDFASVRRHGMIRGTYHYARPSGVTNAQITADATAEANFFVRTTGTLGAPGDLPPVLDIEVAGALNPTELSLWTHTWLDRAQSLTGRTPIVYTCGLFWRQKMGNSAGFAAYPLWLASYGVTRPVMVGGWKRYTFWQYTPTGLLAGSGLRVDLNVFNGSLAQLQAMTSKKSVKTVKTVKTVKWGKSVMLNYTTRPDVASSSFGLRFAVERLWHGRAPRKSRSLTKSPDDYGTRAP